MNLAKYQLVICVPSIKTKLKLPGLQTVVSAFLEKEYELADEFLDTGADEITGIDLILGNNDAQLLPQHEIIFGKEPSSIIIETPRRSVVRRSSALPTNYA